MPSKVTLIVMEFMFLGINIFWAILRAHFNPRLGAQAKMSLSRAQNSYAQEHKLYCYIIVDFQLGLYLIKRSKFRIQSHAGPTDVN